MRDLKDLTPQTRRPLAGRAGVIIDTDREVREEEVKADGCYPAG